MIIIEAPDTIRLPFDSPAGPLLLIRGDLARRLLTGSPELTDGRRRGRAMGAVSRAPVSRIIGARPDPGVAIRLFTVSSSDGRGQDRCRARTAGRNVHSDDISCQVFFVARFILSGKEE